MLYGISPKQNEKEIMLPVLETSSKCWLQMFPSIGGLKVGYFSVNKEMKEMISISTESDLQNLAKLICEETFYFP